MIEPPCTIPAPTGAGVHSDRTVLFSYGLSLKTFLSDYRNRGPPPVAGAERDQSSRERLSDEFYKKNESIPQDIRARIFFPRVICYFNTKIEHRFTE